MELDSCRVFINDILKQQGALKVTDLLNACRAAPNCPRKLKSVETTELKLFLDKQKDFFIEKDGKICSAQLEHKFKESLLLAVQKENNFSVKSATDLLKSCDKSTSKYIQIQGADVGVIDFLNRHSDTFKLRNGSISLSTEKNVTTKDADAVKYFLGILTKKGDLSMTALSGHWNQAPQNVKAVVSTSPLLFKDFLKRNSDYFCLNGDVVSQQEPSSDALSLNIDADESVRNTVLYFMQKLTAKGSQTLQQLVSGLNLDGTPEIVGTVGSKKLGDVESFLLSHPTLFKVENNNVSLKCQNDIQACKLVAVAEMTRKEQSVEVNCSAVSTRTLPGSEAYPPNTFDCKKSASMLSSTFINDKCFENLFGISFSSSLAKLLSSISLKDISKVEMIWADVNRKPFIKVLLDDPTMRYAIHELSDLPAVTQDDLRQLISKLSSITNEVYGMKDSLHTFRVNRLGSDPIGITMFHQVHCHSTDKLEELEHKNLRAILHNRLETCSNDLYSYIRTISATLSCHHHVFIVDFNGKLVGYNQTTPNVVGRSRCIHSVSFPSRRDALLAAYAHNPDCIVTNCLDIMDEEVVKLLKNLTEQGIQVIVPLSQDYKDFVSKHFTSGSA